MTVSASSKEHHRPKSPYTDIPPLPHISARDKQEIRASIAKGIKEAQEAMARFREKSRVDPEIMRIPYTI